MPAQQRVRAVGLEQADSTLRRLGREARGARIRAGVSQSHLSARVGASRQWLGGFESGRLQTVDLRRVTLLFAHLGLKLAVTAYPVGEPIRDAGHVRLLERFNRRLGPVWRRRSEAVMPRAGDLRAWDELLRGPVSIGVEAETRLTDLQATLRAIAGKQRDSGVDRVVLVVAASAANRGFLNRHVALVRQTFPLDTRSTLAAMGAGRDPGANGLVLV